MKTNFKIFLLIASFLLLCLGMKQIHIRSNKGNFTNSDIPTNANEAFSHTRFLENKNIRFKLQ